VGANWPAGSPALGRLGSRSRLPLPSLQQLHPPACPGTAPGDPATLHNTNAGSQGFLRATGTADSARPGPMPFAL